ARCARRHLGERARGLHRSRAPAGAPGRAGMAPQARGDGLPAPAEAGRRCRRRRTVAPARARRRPGHHGVAPVSHPRAAFLHELGIEELPASYIAPALEALAAGLKETLGEARVLSGDWATFATPRR